MRVLVFLLLGALQDPAAAEKLFRQLGDADPQTRERATRELLDGFKGFQESIERRLAKGDPIDAEAAARLRSILQEGPAWTERRDLKQKLDFEFARKNAEHLKALFGTDKEAFIRATDRMFRENPRTDPAVVECYLYSFRKEAALGWLKDDPYVDYVLYVEPPESLRVRISAVMRPLIDHDQDDVAWRSLRIVSHAEGRAFRPVLLRIVEGPRDVVRQVALSLLVDQVAPADADWLEELLRHKDGLRRDAGLQGLVRLNAADRADAIVPLLDDPICSVRRRAVEALGKLKANAHAARLVPLLADPTKDGADARSWAYVALLELRSAAAEDEAARLVDHAEPRVREQAVQLLGHWKAARHAAACARALADKHTAVRAAAVDALAALGAESGKISKALDNPSDFVRGRAAVALGRLRQQGEAAGILERVAAGKLDTASAIEALIRMDAREHAEKVGEMVATYAVKLPDLKGLFCGNDERLIPHRQFEELLKLAVEWKCEACMVPLARAAVKDKGKGGALLLRALSQVPSAAVGEILAAEPAAATPEARRGMASALAAAPSEKAVRGIMEIVRAAKPEDLFHLEHDVKGLSAAPDLLAPYLGDPEPRVRSLAVHLLCDARDVRQAPRAVKMLSDPAPEVRIRAAYALRLMPTREPHAALALLLKDADPLVRRCAIQIILELDVKEAAPLLAPLLGNPGQWKQALDALVRLEAGDSWKEIVPLLGNPEKAPSAAEALGMLKAEAAREPLAKAAREGDAPLRAAAVVALAALGVKVDEALLSDADPRIRAAAVRAAGILKASAMEEAVAKRLEDPSTEVVVEALRALGEMGARLRSDAVAAKLASKDANVASAAAWALVGLDGREHAKRVKERILSSSDMLEAISLPRALVRLDPRGHMEFHLDRAAGGWGGTIYYELNRARAPKLYERVGRVRLSEIRLLEPLTYRGLAARLHEVHGIDLVFDEQVPNAVRDGKTAVMGLCLETHRWLELFAIPQGFAPVFDEETGRIRVLPTEDAKRLWLDWAGKR